MGLEFEQVESEDGELGVFFFFPFFLAQMGLGKGWLTT